MALVAAGCANVALPPGGPVDEDRPRLVETRPVAGATRVELDSELRLQFSESVEARAVEEAVVISPQPLVATYDLSGDRVIIRPRQGWRPSTTYQVTILPEIRDVTEGNRLSAVEYLFFSTGDSLDPAQLSGRLAIGENPVVGARIELGVGSDTIRYVTRSDSAGRYLLAHLPVATYQLLAYQDRDGDLEYDRGREAGAGREVTLGLVPVEVALALRVEDLSPPRVKRVRLAGPLWLVVETDDPLDPDQPLPLREASLQPVEPGPTIEVVIMVVDDEAPRALHLFLERTPEPEVQYRLSLPAIQNAEGLPLVESDRSRIVTLSLPPPPEMDR